MSLPAPKPTGVFVRLPITNEQAQEMYQEYCAAYASSSLTTRGTATQAALLAIGTPIQDSVPIAAYLVNDDDGMRAILYTSRTEDVFPCVLQKHHHVAVASLQAEVLRLREALDRIRLVPFPMMDLPASIMHGIAHKALLKGGAA